MTLPRLRKNAQRPIDHNNLAQAVLFGKAPLGAFLKTMPRTTLCGKGSNWSSNISLPQAALFLRSPVCAVHVSSSGSVAGLPLGRQEILSCLSPHNELPNSTGFIGPGEDIYCYLSGGNLLLTP